VRLLSAARLFQTTHLDRRSDLWDNWAGRACSLKGASAFDARLRRESPQEWRSPSSEPRRERQKRQRVWAAFSTGENKGGEKTKGTGPLFNRWTVVISWGDREGVGCAPIRAV